MNDELHAGPLSATLVGADLVDVRWGALEVAGRILVTVRDPVWGTSSPAVRSRAVERTAGGFRVELNAQHDDVAIAFAWRGVIEARADGSLTFAIEGEAERDFMYRRIGICVLHPWRAYVGAAYEAADGTTFAEGTFPRSIVPQLLRDGRYRPMIEAFSTLAVRFPGGVAARFAFEGERFELEDQRNWTDASFKTYPTPLALSDPRTIRAGERVTQRMTLRVEGSPSPAAMIDEVVVVRVGEPTGRLMPPIGLVAPGDPRLSPAHLRLDVNVPTHGDAGLAAAASAVVPLEVALLVDDRASGVEAIGPMLADVPIARLLIHLRSGATIPGSLVEFVRARLGAVADGMPIVGGTSSYFSELNRLPPDGVGVDSIAFGISPTVHAADERSMMETLEIQGEVVLHAGMLGNGLPVVVSPVTLGAHIGSPFADAWTIGSVAALVAAGATSITYETPTPSLARVTGLRGARLRDVTVSRPDAVAAMVAGDSLLIANLTAVPQAFQIADRERSVLSPYEVRSAVVEGEAASS